MKQKVTLSDEVIKDIAGHLQCGNSCWYHIPTGEVLWAPDRDSLIDEEIWEDVYNEIDEKMHECIPFECLEPHESFKIMESFAENEVGDKRLRAKLITALSNRKPFRHFKVIIDNSNYRQAWFAFKDQWYLEHVKEELDWYNRKDENYEIEED